VTFPNTGPDDHLQTGRRVADTQGVPESTFKWDLHHEWTDDSSWEGLAFTLYFLRPLLDHQQQELQRLLIAWYDVGSFGGYGQTDAGKGLLHFMSDILFKNDESEPRAEWWVDMGSASRLALSSLLMCLQNWSSETGVELTKLVFGHHADFTAE
jgi:hypothetical protein